MGILKRYQEGGKVEDTPEKSDLELMMESVIKTEGGKPEDYHNIMNTIAYHESKYLKTTDDGKKEYVYLDPQAKQQGGGPGRGLFMFEIGENAGGKTAVNRTINRFKRDKIPIPKWLEDASKEKSIDASKFTADQQKVLFLGYHSEHPKADLSQVISGKQTLTDFWGLYHQTQNDPKKKELFEQDKINYEKTKTVTPPKRTRGSRRRGVMISTNKI